MGKLRPRAGGEGGVGGSTPALRGRQGTQRLAPKVIDTAKLAGGLHRVCAPPSPRLLLPPQKRRGRLVDPSPLQKVPPLLPGPGDSADPRIRPPGLGLQTPFSPPRPPPPVAGIRPRCRDRLRPRGGDKARASGVGAAGRQTSRGSAVAGKPRGLSQGPARCGELRGELPPRSLGAESWPIPGVPCSTSPR